MGLGRIGLRTQCLWPNDKTWPTLNKLDKVELEQLITMRESLKARTN